ncbi:response regulator [Clostridium sp. MCC353]|nr:response regulator [Clostridium sp. MCC353]
MTVISQQKNQMLLTAESVAKTMEISLERNAADLKQLCMVAEETSKHPDMKGFKDQIFQRYIDEQENFVTGIIISRKGEITRNTLGIEIEKKYAITDMGNGIQMTQCRADDGKIYFLLGKELESGERISQVIDADRYFNTLISDIKIGTNGYIMVKNSAGIILMHPVPEQRGIDAVGDRKEMYNLQDLKSLEHMLQNQYQGKSGVSEYISYWWADSSLPRVKKISAYTPAKIGSDFLIISAVMDYNDIYIPIANGYIRIIGLLLVMFLAIMGAAGYFVRLLFQRQKDSEEIAYLKELNGILEQTQRSEEIIAHQQRLQIMGTMTGGIAHEFNNLLTPIMGYADLMLAEMPEDSEYFEDVAEIYDAAVKAKEIIRQISSLSRKNMETAYKAISVKQMMKRALKMVHSVCPSNVRLSDETDFDSEWILGNETQLNQVVLNICVNAIHAIGHEEGRITVTGKMVERAELADLPLGSKVSDMWKYFVRIDFEDTGCGMNQDVLEQIFDPFFTTKKNGKGTGLGLALVEQIIHSHKGYIYAESELGKGSIFHIFLPVNDNALNETEQDIPAAQSRKKILIVDDNAKVLKLLEKNFKKINLSMTGAVNSREALEALEKGHYDVMVIDDFLADTSAIDFCMSIRMKYPYIIKLVMTDKIRKEILEARQKGIIEGYVEKPVSVASILEMLRTLNVF